MPGVERGATDLRAAVKRGLARVPERDTAGGATLLIYHRVGGGTDNELDLHPHTFRRQLDILDGHDVLSLDDSLDRLNAGDVSPSVVLTFDDGFADVYENAWPLLKDRRLPFTIYLASAYMGEPMVWEGATATGQPGRGLSWAQLEEMLASGLCTLGNHTHHHVRPEALTIAELDECTTEIQRHLRVTPRHFTYPWGVRVPPMDEAMRDRFRSASTGELGRNLPGTNLQALARVPVRRTDPDAFFAAKLTGSLRAERAYAALVGGAKLAKRTTQRLTRRR